MAPFVHQTVLALVDMTAAVAQAGARAHAGNLVLAKLTCSLQKARPGPAQAQSSSSADSACFQCVWSCSCAEVASSLGTLELLIMVHADPAGGRQMLPSRGRELPVC